MKRFFKWLWKHIQPPLPPPNNWTPKLLPTVIWIEAADRGYRDMLTGRFCKYPTPKLDDKL